MTLLSSAEKKEAAWEVRRLILASGQEAMLLRKVTHEDLYGSDDATYEEVGAFPFEFVKTPPEELSQNIDATACVLPELQIGAEDRLRINGEKYRVQTVEEQRLFGVTTHKDLKLVRIHGS